MSVKEPKGRDAKSSILSKNLLQMKFMQRSKEKVERMEEEQKTSHLLDHELGDSVRAERRRIIAEPSSSLCEGLIFGRLSFKGMNLEVERLMQEAQEKAEGAETGEGRWERKGEAEVTRKEMAERYASSARNEAGNPRKRVKYVRPVDDDDDEGQE